MKAKLALPVLALLLCAPLSDAITPAKEKAAREEILLVFDQRRVALTIPQGFIYSAGKDDRGVITAKITDRKEKIDLQISFMPDPDGQYSSARGRKELMVKSFQRYVSGSVEKAMQFEELDPRVGGGTYCVFTDSDLVGQATPPPHEYFKSTVGIKSWPGVIAVFTLLSNDTKSDEYLAALNILRESVAERPGPYR